MRGQIITSWNTKYRTTNNGLLDSYKKYREAPGLLSDTLVPLSQQILQTLPYFENIVIVKHEDFCSLFFTLIMIKVHYPFSRKAETFGTNELQTLLPNPKKYKNK